LLSKQKLTTQAYNTIIQ